MGQDVPGPFRVGQTIGGARVEGFLGKGAMGVVYRARDARGREVAVKTLLGSAADAEGLARFEREVMALSRAGAHPNVVGVHGAGTEHGCPYVVLDLVRGQPLDELIILSGSIPIPRAVELGAALARAVAHVHAAGVLHRDRGGRAPPTFGGVRSRRT